MDALNAKQFAKSLSKDGFSVTLNINPKFGCGGEFYIFLITKEKKEIAIFSNNKNKHPNAILGYSISNRNYQLLLNKVKEIVSEK